MTQGARHQLLLVAICAVTYFFNLGSTHLWEEDEAYFGRTAREMSQRGDLVVPYFNGEISLHKPALMYWVMLAGTKLFGFNEFGLRFGSVLFSIGSVLLTYHLGRILFSSARTGFWSGLVLATSLHFAVVARAAVVDPELIFFCSLPILIFVHGIQRRRVISNPSSASNFQAVRATELSWANWALAYASMAMATLAKGPVGIVLPTAVIGLFLLMNRTDAVRNSLPEPSSTKPWLLRGLIWFTRVFWPSTVLRTTWEMRPFTAIGMLLLIAAPWYVWVGLRTDGEWLRGFFFVHNYGRFVNSFEKHSGGPLYYIVAICIGIWPWCMFNYQAVRQTIAGLWSGSPDRPQTLLLCGWIAVWVGVFTLAGTKLPHYVLPAYPAVAILFGHFVDRWLSGTSSLQTGWMRASWITPIVVGVGLMIAMPFVAQRYLPGEHRLALIGIIPVVGGILGFWLSERQQRGWAAATISGMAVLFLMTLLGWGAVRVDRFQKSFVVASWLKEVQANQQAEVGALGCFEACLLYYCDRNIDRLTSESAEEFFLEHPGQAFLLTTDRSYAEIEEHLPRDVCILKETQRFLKPQRLMLLGRKPTASTIQTVHFEQEDAPVE